MAKYIGTQTVGGDTTLGTEDLIQDAFTNGIDGVKIVHFYFYTDSNIEIQVDDSESLWISAETEWEFTTQFDLKKMPKKNFKVLTAGAVIDYLIILE